MASSSLLCRVQALYSFDSDHPSSLKFHQGDYIDVLAKLPSGWWDGWCNGARGWFPSNFVRVIQQEGCATPPKRSSNMTTLFDDRVGGPAVADKRMSLPPNWSMQEKQDGSASYYLNNVTGEMRSSYPYDSDVFYDYHSEDEDSATSTVDSHVSQSMEDLVTTQWSKRQSQNRLPFLFTSQYAMDTQQPRIVLEKGEQLTWSKLSIYVAFTINQLLDSTKSVQRALYKQYAARVVEAVRFMLVASSTISKDSIYIKTNSVLRSHHRAMMASMSKLVLSSQLCADSGTSDVSRLLSDGHELLIAVRNFTSTCESIPVMVNHVDPIVIQNKTTTAPTSPTETIRARHQLDPDLTDNLYAYGAGMKESMESLIANTSKQHDTRCSLAVLLFTQYRNFGNQNGQFLSIIEEIDFKEVSKSPKLKELLAAKQSLYDGLGILFFKMQTMTDESVPMETVLEEITTIAQSIIDAIKVVCDRMAALVTLASLRRESTTTTRKFSFDSGHTDTKSISYLTERRSHSVDTITTLPTSVSSKKTNRSSAPVTADIRSIEASSPKLHTLTETQSKHTSAKLKQFFGDDPSEIVVPPTSPGEEATPKTSTEELSHAFLQYEYGPREIVFTVDGSVKGGTLRALVERMTLHDYLDMNFNNTFLLTYRSFCTSMELLELLEERYSIQAPPDLTPEELEIWTAKKQKLVRLRVFNVLKIWLEQYYYEEDSVILDRLLFFTDTTIKNSLSFSAYQLEKLIHKRKEACKDLKKMVMTQHTDLPDSILPRNLKKFRLLDLDPVEMARQLTLMDFKLYSSIKPVECLDKAWSKNSSDAANIQASIDYCNQVTTWVSDEILSQSEVKKRSALIKYWVNVAERCRVLNSFNTCMAVLSAFDNSAVGRLKRTWEMVGARTNHILSHIRKLMGANKNFNQYRVLIHSVNPPCIPFLGIYLQDLTFIEDGNSNFLKTSKDLINFAKRARTAEVIREIQQYQSMGYQFRPVEEIQAFIQMNLHSSRDEDQLYRESLKLEPKEREDEKITRLLQESGFL